MDLVKGVFWNAGEGRPRALWRILPVLVLWFVGFVLVAVAPGVLLGDGPVAFQFGIFVLGGAWLALLVFVSARLLDRRRVADFGLRFGESGWWRDFGAGIAILLVAQAGFFLYPLATGLYEVQSLFASPGLPFLVALAPLALATLVQASTEEFVFRGHLLRNAAEGLRSRRVSAAAALVGAFLVSGLVFSFLHLGQDGSVLGLVLLHMVSAAWYSAAFVLTGSLALPLGLHFANNLYIAMFVGPTGGGPVVFGVASRPPEWWLDFSGIAYKVVALALVLVYVWWSRGGLRPQTELAEYEPNEKASGEKPKAPSTHSGPAPEAPEKGATEGAST